MILTVFFWPGKTFTFLLLFSSLQFMENFFFLEPDLIVWDHFLACCAKLNVAGLRHSTWLGWVYTQTEGRNDWKNNMQRRKRSCKEVHMLGGWLLARACVRGRGWLLHCDWWQLPGLLSILSPADTATLGWCQLWILLFCSMFLCSVMKVCSNGNFWELF